MKFFKFISVFFLMTLTLQAEPKKLDPLTAKIKKFEIEERSLPEAIVILNKQIAAEYPDHKYLLVGFVDRTHSEEHDADADLEKALGGGVKDLGGGGPRKGSFSIDQPIPIQVAVKYLCGLYAVHFGKYEQTLVIYGWQHPQIEVPEEGGDKK